MKIEIHHYHHLSECESESLSLIRQIFKGLKEGTFIMAMSPEMQAFVDGTTAAFTATSAALASQSVSLANIVADIQRLLDGGSLSTEDKEALNSTLSSLQGLQNSMTQAASELEAASQIVPEP